MKRVSSELKYPVDPPLAEGEREVDRRAILAAIDAAADDAATVAKLQSLLPEQIEHTETRSVIEYEAGDRVVVGVGGGQVAATISYLRDNGQYRGFLDSDPASHVDFPSAAIVQQATEPQDGKVEYLTPIKEGWRRVPHIVSMLNVGDMLRACPWCGSVITSEEEAQKECGDCGRRLTAVHVMALEAL